MSKVRVKWVDYGKAVGIILMLYGHLNSKWFPALGESIKWIYTFHMPFFFLLSGIFFSDKKDFKTFFTTKIKSLILPYYVFSILAFVKPIKNVVTNNFSFPFDVLYIKNVFLDQLIMGNGLWFLMALFGCNIILYAACEVSKHKIRYTACIVIAVSFFGFFITKNTDILLPFQILQSMKNVIYVFIGYSFRKKDLFNKIKIPIAIGLVFIWISVNLLSLYYYGQEEISDNIMLCFLCAFSMIVGLSVLIKRLEKNISDCNFLDVSLTYIGCNSLVFYIFNDVVLKMIKFVVFIVMGISFEENSPLILQLFVGICCIIISLCVLSFITLLVNKYIPWSIGKSKIG